MIRNKRWEMRQVIWLHWISFKIAEALEFRISNVASDCRLQGAGDGRNLKLTKIENWTDKETMLRRYHNSEEHFIKFYFRLNISSVFHPLYRHCCAHVHPRNKHKIGQKSEGGEKSLRRFFSFVNNLAYFSFLHFIPHSFNSTFTHCREI